jgi:AP-1 complex subunit mu
MTAIEKFLPLLENEDEEAIQTPIVSSEEGVHFLYIRHSNLYRKSNYFFVNHY